MVPYSRYPIFLAKTIIVPSIWNEAFGRVVVEAKQFSCNIIISDKGGLKEALGAYNNGRVAHSFDDYKLHRGIFKLKILYFLRTTVKTMKQERILDIVN